MPEVTMHDLRRSFASYLVSNGIDPKMVMQAMNQPAAAASRYQWMNNATKQAAVLALPKADFSTHPARRQPRRFPATT